MKKRHVMRALVAAATALALTACGSTGSSDTSKSTSTASAASTSSGSEADTENTITIPAGESVSQDSDVTAMIGVDFTTMDPMDTSDTLSGGVQRMMMDGLFGFDENMQIIPMLATSYEANDEATEYTIHLREGVSFTDGTPWNADALIANVNKWADKSLGLKRTTFLCNVLDHAEKIDDYTVKIYLAQSFGAFISNLAHPATLIMSPKQIEAGEDACAQAPVGTGQYKFVEWVAGDHMKVELNKDWWGYDADVCGGTALADADAGFKSITFKPVAESATRVSAIQAGDAQIMWSVPTESVDTLKGDSNVSVGMGDSIAVWYFFMNTQKAPFNDVKVREAMAYAINKEAYIQVVMNGYGSVATSMVGEEVQHYKGNDPYSYDPEKAKELLKEAGYEDTDGDGIVEKDGEPLSLRLVFQTEEYASWKSLCEFLKSEYEKVGVGIELVEKESAAYYDEIWNTRDYDLCIYRSYEDSWMPHGFLKSMFYAEDGAKAVNWYDEELNKDLGEVLKTQDEEKRTELYDKILTRINDQAVTVPLYYPNRDYIYNNTRLTNVELAPTAYEGINWATLDVVE